MIVFLIFGKLVQLYNLVAKLIVYNFSDLNLALAVSFMNSMKIECAIVSTCKTKVNDIDEKPITRVIIIIKRKNFVNITSILKSRSRESRKIVELSVYLLAYCITKK